MRNSKHQEIAPEWAIGIEWHQVHEPHGYWKVEPDRVIQFYWSGNPNPVRSLWEFEKLEADPEFIRLAPGDTRLPEGL